MEGPQIRSVATGQKRHAELLDQLGNGLCLYGICEAAVLAAGYAPAIGFIHTGKPLSLVYDIADLFKCDDIIPHSFKIAAKNYPDPERD